MFKHTFKTGNCLELTLKYTAKANNYKQKKEER